MNGTELAKLLNAKIVTAGKNQNAEVTCGYACDLLSWVLAHGRKGMAWATVQTHVNVVAVAVLMEMSCVILAEDNHIEAASLAKAEEEGLTVMETAMTAYEICGRMFAAGITPSDR
ncbi:MAG TPA: AraC family transcriptional regulator [Candidatus Limiplasma sp.]|nr:AraC family transcriptional regulator [Candidatus Limiplasma sp.]HPR77251.1 AraC family transcriptional regulator [Candidatus Limiplasma sp.]